MGRAKEKAPPTTKVKDEQHEVGFGLYIGLDCHIHVESTTVDCC